MKNKDIEKTPLAQIYDINPAFQEDLGNYIINFVEKFTYESIDNWENFCIDSFYREYQKYGFTKVLVINREEFKRFLLWALPKWLDKENEK